MAVAGKRALAGDELVPQPHKNLNPEQIELLAATGFLRMAPDVAIVSQSAAERFFPGGSPVGRRLWWPLRQEAPPRELEVVGVEPSEGFLTLARQAVPDRRAEFRQGGGDAIPLDDGAADYAVTGLVLNFIPDQAKALAELMRVTAPGGTVAAYVWDYAGHTQFMRRFWDAAIAVLTADPSIFCD